MSEVLQTQEVGSLRKPSWRIQPLKGLPVTDNHIAEAVEWDVRLGLDPDESIELLQAAQQETELSHETVTAIKRRAALQAVRLQEKAGIDIVYDGEQDRPEMYQDAIDKTSGFERRGRLLSFDRRSFLKSAVVARPGFIDPWYDRELERVKGLTDHPIKVPLTGAYTLADWSFNEYYAGSDDPKRSFVLDLAQRVIRSNLEQLAASGVDWIQVDEPAATTKPDEVDLFVESFNRSTAGLLGRFSTHICFSDYGLLLPAINRLENCSQFSLEFANRDHAEFGTRPGSRPVFDVLKDISQACPEAAVGLGVTSIHEDAIESPELVRDRILYAVDIMGDPAKVYPSPDCGLRTRSWQVAYEKLAVTAEGAYLARQAIGG